jgi:hypothetical protein
VDAKHGFILATILSPASVHDTNFLQYCTIFGRHTNKPIKIVYADKGYAGLPNRNFLKTRPRLSSQNGKSNATKTSPRCATSSNSILGSVTFTTKPSELGLQRS